MSILIHQGYELSVLQSTLDQMHLTNGQAISSPAQKHQVVELNALALEPEMLRRYEAGEKGVPDPHWIRKHLHR